mmetsp:Transcript_11271/g.18630  ORF Transcript_11271/g.18630 Transcript_11271/m.18630 type:complete len:406 (+) Transcript_11271:71-1288(+)
MMSTEMLDAQSSAVIGNVGKREQSSNTKQQSGISIQVVDSRADLFTDLDDDQRPSSRENIAEEEEADTKTQQDEIAAADDQVSADDMRKVNELRQAILELRVYTCKLKGTNRHLQRQNELVKEENMSLANSVHRLERDGLSLKEENEQLRRELELLKKNKLDTTMSTLSSHGDDVLEIEENSHTIDPVPLSITIDPKLEYIPTIEHGDDDSDEVQHKRETTKPINKPVVTPKSGRTPLTKSRETLYDIDDLRSTITNDKEEDDEVDLRLELGKYREQCEELQLDLRKIAQDYWKQREDLKEYKSRINELQTENSELQRLKWVEAEVDAMWALVKKWDKENSRWDVELETLRAEKEVLKASIVDKSNEIAELKDMLRNGPCPEWVKVRMDDIQNDLEQMRSSQTKL